MVSNTEAAVFLIIVVIIPCFLVVFFQQVFNLLADLVRDMLLLNLGHLQRQGGSIPDISIAIGIIDDIRCPSCVLLFLGTVQYLRVRKC